VCRTKPDAKGKYIKIILALLQSPSAAVTYECAVTLTSLSQAPTAVRAAANCYCQLLVSQSDNNVKLIVLDRLQELKDKHRDVMQVSGRVAAGFQNVHKCKLLSMQRCCMRCCNEY
jgi:coatomer subunit beta